jgi:hypothetical protein
MKRLGALALAVLLGIVTWYSGAFWHGAGSQALAQAVTPIAPASDEAYLLSYFDVATAFVPSAGGYGGPGNSGGSGDALLRIVDAGNWEADTKEGRVCANIYVFNDVQEEQECCACALTANELTTVSVINGLTSNPLNPTESLSAGVVKIVGSPVAEGCSNKPGAVTAANVTTLTGGLHAWISHTETMASNQPNFNPPWGFVTTTSVEDFEHSDLDSGELTFLKQGCQAINAADRTGSQSIGICTCAPPEPPPVAVSVAYANTFNAVPPFVPTNGPGWKGSAGVTPGVNFFGFAGNGDFDSGGILIENKSATDPLTVNSVTVDFNQVAPPLNCTVGTGTTLTAANCNGIASTLANPTDPWVGVFPHAIAPGAFLILTQTNAGLTDPSSGLACTLASSMGQCDNFDTSDLPPLGLGQFPTCQQGGVIPKLHINVTFDGNTVTLNFTDANRVLNTDGIDGALCFNSGHGPEGHDWEQIH